MASFAQKYSDKLKEMLSSTSADRARSFMYEFGYTRSALPLPEYFKSNFNSIKLIPIDWDQNGLPKRTRPLEFFAPKGDMVWRRFSLLHPYIYWHMIDTITQPKNWEEIKLKLSSDSLVNSYSIPIFEFDRKHPSIKGHSIRSWLKFAEEDLIIDSASYTTLAITDIRDFYQSIYTHSIAWALHGKSLMKKRLGIKKGKLLLGEKLDKLFQNSRDGQTNGIPIGNLASDIIGEIILNDIDQKFSERILNNHKKIKFSASRFRDDYRFLCENEASAKIILNEFNRLLHDEFDLMINTEKTRIFKDIILNFKRPWITLINNSLILSKLQSEEVITNKLLSDVIIEAYTLQNQYPKSRVAVIVLMKLFDKLTKAKLVLKTEESTYQIIVLLRKLMLTNEEILPFVAPIFDKILENFPKEKVKKIILNVLNAVTEYTDKEFLLIWLHRLVKHLLPEQHIQIFKNYKRHPLIGILLDRNNESLSYFNKISTDAINTVDLKELSKFKIVDKTLLDKVSGKQLEITKIFGYFTNGAN